MAKITYVEADGSSKTIEVPTGWSLMQGAVANGVNGIVGECGGSMACATCHCYVDPARFAELPKADPSEIDMLDLAAAEVKPNSRLSCQILSTPKLEGLVLYSRRRGAVLTTAPWGHVEKSFSKRSRPFARTHGF